MPAGVFSPEAMARSIDADTKSRRAAKHQAVPPADLVISTLMDRDEAYLERKALMERARAGDQKAHAELWRLYRCTLEVRR